MRERCTFSNRKRLNSAVSVDWRENLGRARRPKNEAQIGSPRLNPNRKGPTSAPHSPRSEQPHPQENLSISPRSLSHAPAWRRSRGGIHHYHQPHWPLGQPLLLPAPSLDGGSRAEPRPWSPRARSAARTSMASCGARGGAPTRGPSASPSRHGRPRSGWTAGSRSRGGSRRPPVPPAPAPLRSTPSSASGGGGAPSPSTSPATGPGFGLRSLAISSCLALVLALIYA